MSCDLGKVLVWCDDSACIQGQSRVWPLVASLFTMQMQLRTQLSPYGYGQSGAVGQVFVFFLLVHLSPCQCHFTNSAHSLVWHRCCIILAIDLLK